MKLNPVKAGILIAILGVPAFVFIFLNLFGENKFELRKYKPEYSNNELRIDSKGDTIFHQVILPNNEKLNNNTVICLLDSNTNATLLGLFSRSKENFKAKENVIFLKAAAEPNPDKDLVFESLQSLYNWKKDQLTDKSVSSYFNTLLIDKNGIIRGYYDLHLKSDLDKLNVEIKVLLDDQQGTFHKND